MSPKNPPEKGKETRIGLCPFCGSPKVYYNDYYKNWRCGRCEKSFPSPSYGSDFAERGVYLTESEARSRRTRWGGGWGRLWSSIGQRRWLMAGIAIVVILALLLTILRR